MNLIYTPSFKTIVLLHVCSSIYLTLQILAYFPLLFFLIYILLISVFFYHPICFSAYCFCLLLHILSIFLICFSHSFFLFCPHSSLRPFCLCYSIFLPFLYFFFYFLLSVHMCSCIFFISSPLSCLLLCYWTSFCHSYNVHCRANCKVNCKAKKTGDTTSKQLWKEETVK